MQHLSFEQVSYTVEGKQVLVGVSGQAHAGRLLAIMGPSGAGKSTLLDILAAREMKGETSGSVVFDGVALRPEEVRKRAGFVRQDDVLLHTATVHETLLTSVRLRCGHLTRSEQDARAEQVMEELGLSELRDSLVGGGEVRGLSGGERRRVSIGHELVSDCDVLFLDEPTSGLDSSTAESVMQCIVDLSNRGRLAVCTIHQPNSDITSMFQDFLLLSNGRVTFFGEWSNAVARFESAGFPCPVYTNPTDFFMKVVKNDAAVAKMVSLQQSDETQVSYGSQFSHQMLHSAHVPAKKVNCATIISILVVRYFKQWLRDPEMFVSELVQYIFYSVFLGLIFFQLSLTADAGVYDRQSSLFFLLSVLSFTPPYTAVITYALERALYRRERALHLYPVWSYVISKTLVIWPIEIFLCCILGTIAYFMIGYQTDVTKFVIFLAITSVFQLINETVGFLCAVATSSTNTGVVLVSFVLVMLLSTGGFLTSSLPSFIAWISYFNFFQFANWALIKNEMQGLLVDGEDGYSLVDDSLKTDLSLQSLLGILLLFLGGLRMAAYIVLIPKECCKYRNRSTPTAKRANAREYALLTHPLLDEEVA